MSSDPSGKGPLALVLSGGGARGAYEIGALRYILGEVAPRLGPAAQPTIFCGTSVGAINACAIAAHVAEPVAGLEKLAHRWRGLRLDDVFRLGWGDLAALARWMFGASREDGPHSLLDAAPLAELVRHDVPWRALHEAIASGRVLGVSVSTTDVETGHTVVFLESARQEPVPSGDPTVQWATTRLTAQHALASAAIPILFPPVRVAGRMFSDGGLRQNTPLAPALKLGAGRVLVVGLRSDPAHHSRPSGRQDESDQLALSSPSFLFGKVLDALLLDRVENDLATLRRINGALAAITRAGVQRGAPPREMVQALEAAGVVLRPVADLFLRPSQDIGKIAAEVIARPSVQARLSGPAGFALRQLGEAAVSGGSSDTLSYLLFDGEYASELMALGEADARALGSKLEEFLAGAGAAAEPLAG